MFDFNTAVQTALTPVVTLPVIAVLVIAIAAQAWRTKVRLREQAGLLGRMTAALLSAVTTGLKSETEREVGRAIEFTYDTLKGIGFDKLAKGEVTFEGVMFGGRMPKGESLRRRQFRDDPLDPLAPFSLDELREALSGKPRFDAKNTGGDGGTVLHEDALGREGAGFGDKGPRPYSKATDFDLSGRSPRAG